MHVLLNQCLRLNMGKAVFAVLAYTLIRLMVLSLGLMPVMGSGEAAAVPVLMLPLAGAAAFVFYKMLSYGLSVIMARMVEKKYVTIGYLFYGFRKGAGRIARAGLVYTAAYGCAIAVALVLLKIFEPQVAALSALAEQNGIQGQSVPALLVLAFLLLVSLLELPFSFVWLVMYNDEKSGVLAAFALAFRRMCGHFFHFIGFELYAGGRDLLAVIVIQAVLLMLPQGDGVPRSVQTLATVLGFAGLVAECRSIVRLYIALPLYYYTLTGVIRPLRDADESAAAPDAGQSSDAGAAQSAGEKAALEAPSAQVQPKDGEEEHPE